MANENSVKLAEQLRQTVKGMVLSPEDTGAPEGGYEQSRLAWVRTVDQHPTLILTAEDAEDVAAGVRFACENQLGVAVQTTGHGLKAPADGGLLILMGHLNAVEVNVEARTAKIGGGAMWRHVVAQVAPHGLAPLLGSAPHVGVVGYTLGGGMGWLARQYGLSADRLRWVEIVTADGVIRHASADENADLFWALRGAGSGMGVVTAIEIDLVPVAKLYGGQLMYPGDKIAEALRFFREWITTTPDALTSSITIMKLPNLPFIPEPMRGRSMAVVRAAYLGSADEGAKLMQPWLDWSAPQQNTLHELPFAEIGTVSNDPEPPSPSYGTNVLLDDLSDAVIEVILKDLNAPLMMTEIRQGGGAIARNGAETTAVSNRDAAFFMQMGGLAPTPEAYQGIQMAVRHYIDDLRPHLRPGAFLNFIYAPDVPRRLREAFTPAMFDRLVGIKAKYDPDNLFRFGYPFGSV